LQCQVGDLVSLGWEAVDVASGKVLTSSKNSPDGKRLDEEHLLSFQMGTDAGFQPKRGLLLAFNYVTEGLKVGEVRSEATSVTPRAITSQQSELTGRWRWNGNSVYEIFKKNPCADIYMKLFQRKGGMIRNSFCYANFKN
jgi:hypothetical protein